MNINIYNTARFERSENIQKLHFHNLMGTLAKLRFFSHIFVSWVM